MRWGNCRERRRDEKRRERNNFGDREGEMREKRERKKQLWRERGGSTREREKTERKESCFGL